MPMMCLFSSKNVFGFQLLLLLTMVPTTHARTADFSATFAHLALRLFAFGCTLGAATYTHCTLEDIRPLIDDGGGELFSSVKMTKAQKRKQKIADKQARLVARSQIDTAKVETNTKPEPNAPTQDETSSIVGCDENNATVEGWDEEAEQRLLDSMGYVYAALEQQANDAAQLEEEEGLVLQTQKEMLKLRRHMHQQNFARLLQTS